MRNFLIVGFFGFSERISTLSPIPSTSSLTTVMTNINPKEQRTFLSAKRHCRCFLSPGGYRGRILFVN